MTDKHEIGELKTANRFGVAIMVLVGLMWLALGLSIAFGGEVVYGALYSGPAIISWIFAYAIWRQPTHV